MWLIHSGTVYYLSLLISVCVKQTIKSVVILMWNRLLFVQVILRKRTIESSNCHTPHRHKVPINVMFSQVLQVIYINNKLTWNLLHTFATVWDETFIRLSEYGGRGMQHSYPRKFPCIYLAFITLWWIKQIKLKQICPFND